MRQDATLPLRPPPALEVEGVLISDAMHDRRVTLSILFDRSNLDGKGGLLKLKKPGAHHARTNGSPTGKLLIFRDTDEPGMAEGEGFATKFAESEKRRIFR